MPAGAVKALAQAADLRRTRSYFEALAALHDDADFQHDLAHPAAQQALAYMREHPKETPPCVPPLPQCSQSCRVPHMS